MTPQLSTAPALAVGGIQLSLATALLVIWFHAREYRIFLWLGAFLAISALNNGHRFLAGSDATIILPILSTILLRAACLALQVEARWLLRLYGAAAILYTVFQLPYGLAGRGEAFNRPLLHVSSIAIIVFGLRAIWRGPLDVRLAGVAFAVYLGVFAYFPLAVRFGEWIFNPVSIVSCVLGFALLGLQLRRLTSDRREKQRLAGELEAARLVQQLLLSDAVVRTKNLIVEATYAPAQEVGGDFYQILHCEDESLLVVVGDVSGKGLRAAMLVSLLTGAIRNRSSDHPARLLAELNRVLLAGNAGGFVTCLCARIDDTGATVFANAGHLAPYRNAREVDVPVGLPLGLAEEEYAETGLQLHCGDALTLVSDGVVEAANPNRELFGFERTRSIASKSAREIAEASGAWGQNDDITVVTVRRNA